MMNPNMSMLAQMLLKNRLGQMPPAGGFNPGPMRPLSWANMNNGLPPKQVVLPPALGQSPAQKHQY